MSSTENCLALSYHFCQPYLIVFCFLCLTPSQVSTLPLTYIHHSSKLSTNKSDHQLSKHRFCFLTDQAKCVLGSILTLCHSDKILENMLQEERCIYFVSQFQSMVFWLLASVPLGQSSRDPVSSQSYPSKHVPGNEAFSMSLGKTFKVQTIRIKKTGISQK